MKNYLVKIFSISIIIYLFGNPLQIKAFDLKKRDFLKKNLVFSGGTNIYGELYNVSGISDRRPPSTGRISMSPNFQIKNVMSISMQILLSTEGTDTRQNMNIFGLHPQWQWGYGHLGDFSDNYSQYTLNGINVKGVGLGVFPKKYRFAVGVGQTKRAVDNIALNESYSQYAGFTKIGYGEESSSYLDIIFLKVKDDVNSLQKPENWEYTYIIADTMENVEDTIWVEPPYNPVSVTPQENVVLGINNQIALFSQKIIMQIEASGSAFNKDITAEKTTFDDINSSKFLESLYNNLFTPRAGSSFDYAVKTTMKINLQQANFEIGYKHIGPGYVSLGTPSNVNDRQEINVRSNAKLGKHRLMVYWNRMNNNLDDQKLQTNVRNQYQFTLYSTIDKWRSNISARFMGMVNEADYDSLEWDYGNLNFSTNQSLVFGKDNILRQVGIQYQLQKTNKNRSEKETESEYHTLNLSASFRLPQSLTMNTSAGLSHRKTGEQEATLNQVYSVKINHVAINNKLTNSLFLTSNMVRDTKMFRTGLNSFYNLGKGYRLSGNLAYNIFKGQKEYRELRVSLMLAYQF